MNNENLNIKYTIKDQVYEIIKDAILGGDYRPGEWLQEPKLAKQMQISRSPIREVLRRLEGDGIVVNIPNKGVFIKELTFNEAMDIFDIRLIFEEIGIKNSINTLDSNVIDKLLSIKDGLTEANNKRDLKKYIKFDTSLHELILNFSDNHVIKNCAQMIFSSSQHFWISFSMDEERWIDSYGEHCAIIECLLKGDIEGALKIDKEHIENGRVSASVYYAKKGKCKGSENKQNIFENEINA